MGQTKSKKSVSPGLHVQWESDFDSTWEEEDERPRKKKKKNNQSQALDHPLFYLHLMYDMVQGLFSILVENSSAPALRTPLSRTRRHRPGFTADFQHKQTNVQHQIPLRDPRSIAARDLQMYRHGYPQYEVRAKEQSSLVSCFVVDNHEEIHYSTPRHTPNLDFYQSKIPFKPNGVYIEELLSDWKYNYDKLERNHSYIQWLFPLREPGRNSSATPLTMDEIQMMRKDQKVMMRFLDAYKLMLGFYGIELQDSVTGKVQKAENWRERFQNLNNHSHNNLRITRILKCLGEMDYDHFQAPLVRFFLESTLRDNYLPNVKRSVLDYFMFTVKNKQERRQLVQFARENYKSHEPFIWGPVEKLPTYSSTKRTRNEERPTSRKNTYRR